MTERAEPPLPDWVDNNRLDSQLHIVEDIVDRFRGRNGQPVHDVVFLQGPTGVGKTLIAELVRRTMHAKTIYSCTTKYLQDQFVHDFPYAKVLKGRSNYLTTLGLVDEMGNAVGSIGEAVTAADCTSNMVDTPCAWCESRGECPYRRAKGRAIAAPLAVLNSSYLLTDMHGPRKFTYRDLYVLDEADTLESELLGHAELHLSNRRLRQFNIRPPRYKTKSETWADWIKNDVLPNVGRYVDTLPKLHEATDTKTIREINYTNNLIDNLWRVHLQLPQGKWVYDGYRERDYEGGDVIFRPVFVAGYGDQLLWKNGQKFLVMSATILAEDVMASELGLNLDDRRVFSLVDVPSTFPAENRPIHVVPIADMTMDKIEEERPKLVKAILGVMKRHPDDRILIHCVSYDLAEYLYYEIKAYNLRHSDDRLLITYTNSRDKNEALGWYKKNPGAVLFAPSMDRGVDLPDDMCRVQVIAKIPYPYLGDKRVKARLYSPGGGDWYALHTIRTIVQMVGRAIRHRQDWAVTYILDKQFGENIWKSHSRMFPRYFKDALNFRFNPRLLTER